MEDIPLIGSSTYKCNTNKGEMLCMNNIDSSDYGI